MARATGFYWVRLLGSSEHPDGWTIGEWSNSAPDGAGHRWRLPGYSFHEHDNAFQEIDERRVERVKRRTWRNDREPLTRSRNSRPTS
jgi:hypothetical protein